jgi:hypothetical protein
LDSIGNVRRELGRLYRASLSGKLESAEAARLAFILKEVRAALESEELRPDPSQTSAIINFSILLEPPTPLPVIVIDDGKLTILNAWRRRQGGDEPGGE